MREHLARRPVCLRSRSRPSSTRVYTLVLRTTKQILPGLRRAYAVRAVLPIRLETALEGPLSKKHRSSVEASEGHDIGELLGAALAPSLPTAEARSAASLQPAQLSNGMVQCGVGGRPFTPRRARRPRRVGQPRRAVLVNRVKHTAGRCRARASRRASPFLFAVLLNQHTRTLLLGNKLRQAKQWTGYPGNSALVNEK